MIGGLAIGALGTVLSARENRRSTEAATQAARFRPFSISGPAGHVGVGENGQVNLTADAEQQAFSDMMRGRGASALRGGLNALGNVNFGPDRQLLRQAGQGFDTRLFGHSNAALRGARGSMSAATANLQDARQQAGAMGDLGMGFLNQAGSMDINQLAADRLANLDALARPGEDRMAAQLGDRLFASGRNATTGGAEQFGQLMQAQERADMERKIMASQFATGEQDRVLGQGMNLIGGGQNVALGAMGGLNAAAANTGNLVGQRGNLIGQRFSQLMGAHNVGLQRGNSRMQQAVARMGAGETMLNTSQQFNPFNNLMSQAALSTSLSSAASGAGATQGSFIAQGGNTRSNMMASMFSGMMSGLGG